MKGIILVAMILAILIGVLPSMTAAQSPACAPSGGLNFICGLQAPEDLVLISNTRWLIASGMMPGSGLHLIDTGAKTARNLFSSDVATARADKTRFASCPGPLDPKLAVLHGLSLRPAATGRYTLYATNHGGRESVEVFEVDARGTTPSATWIGCVLTPDKLAANSVAAFRDGTLVATVLQLPGKTFEDRLAGRNTGIVLMWTPGSKEFRMLPGTELVANNGIETSTDDHEFYVVSAYPSKRIVAFARTDSSKPLRFAQLKDVSPDNVRLIGNRLITAGMIWEEPSCGGIPKKLEDLQCPHAWIVDAVDPKTMAVTEIARGPAATSYSGTAMAIPVGKDLWLSSFNSDRVAYLAYRR
jgi:hypothetical protein